MRVRNAIRAGVCAAASWGCTVATASDTSFTYQGVLHDGGSPASGTYTVAISAWDALAGGSQVGTTQTFNNVPVADGRFTLEVDFGGNVMQGDRWLQLAVNGTTLSPRQPVTGTPYAQRMRGMFTNSNGTFVGAGRSSQVSSTEAFGVFAPAGTGTDYGGMYVSTPSVNARPYYGYSAGGTRAWTYLDGASDDWHVYNDGVRMTVTDNGRVGIGTMNPEQPFHSYVSGLGNAVYGQATQGFYAGVWGRCEGDGGYGVFGQCDEPGGYDFFAGGAGVNYGSSSSARWKRNVEAIDSPLEKLAQIRGVYFDWDQDHGGHRDVGMIAEEVGAVLPEIVNFEDNGIDAVGMDYSKLAPLLVEAVKELRAEKDAEIKELRQRIAELEALVERPGSTDTETTQ